MFNSSWYGIIALFGIIGLVLGYAPLVALALLLLTVIPVASAWNRWALRRIGYERRLSERRAFVGETLDLKIDVANRKLLPVAWLRVQDEFPVAVPLVDSSLSPSHLPNTGYLTNLYSLRWHERITRSFQLKCVERGFYHFGPAHLQGSDLFGLFENKSDLPDQLTLIIYPRVRPVEQFELPPKEPFGSSQARQRIFQDPSRTIGVRDHEPPDGLRHIHWKATARQQRLQVKVYEPTTSHNLILVLNVNTLPEPLQGCDPAALERAVSLTASIAQHAFEEKYLVGVLANGTVPHSDQSLKVLPGRSPDQLMRVLEALAQVTAFATSNLARLITAESPRMPWGATLVVITAILSEEICTSLLQLRRAGRRVVLISLAGDTKDWKLPGIPVYQAPPRDPADGAPWSLTRVEEAA